jgi:hypothetical protein
MLCQPTLAFSQFVPAICKDPHGDCPSALVPPSFPFIILLLVILADISAYWQDIPSDGALAGLEALPRVVDAEASVRTVLLQLGMKEQGRVEH